MGSSAQFLNKIRRAHGDVKVLAVATVLHEGWELDNYIAIVDSGNGPFALTTDHGGLIRADASTLEYAIKKHDRASATCLKALLALGGQDGP